MRFACFVTFLLVKNEEEGRIESRKQRNTETTTTIFRRKGENMAAAAKVWALDQMLRMLEKGTMTYSNIYQRSYVWDRETECNLIASLIEGRDIPAITANRHITANKTDGTLFDLLNGKQRLTASEKFKNNEFQIADLRKLKLSKEDAIDLSPEEKESVHYYVDEEGREVIDINGLYFKDLPEILQRIILSRGIRIEYHDNMSREDERQTIINANSGKGMTTAEKLRVEMASFEQVVELAKHPIFQSALTAKAIAGYWNEKLVEQIYCMLYMDEPALDIKSFRPFIRDAEFTEEQVETIQKILDRLLEIYKIVSENDKIKSAKTRILGKVHIITVAQFIKKSLDENVPVERMAAWMEYFFSGRKRATISDVYNEWASRNTNQKKSIEQRLNAMAESYDKYVTNGEEIPEVIKPVKATKPAAKKETIRTVVNEESINKEETEDMTEHDNASNIDGEADFPEQKTEETEKKSSETVRTVVDGSSMNLPEEEPDEEDSNEDNSDENTDDGTFGETDSDAGNDEIERMTEEDLERELLEERRQEEELLKRMESGEDDGIINLEDF